MDFTNETPFPGKLLTGSTGEREMIAIVATKVTFVLDEGRHPDERRLLAVTGDEAWPVFDKPFSFDGVTLGAETDFRKQGTDLLVFGSARAPRGEAVTWTRVAVECGQIRYEAIVFGDRVWQATGAGYVATAPAPFTEMPLTNDRAFGGEARIDDSTVVQHPVNPEGRGYLFLEEDVEGTPLPNVEHPERRISSWRDHPPPRCFYKPLGASMDDDDAGSPEDQIVAMATAGLNQTVPELVAPSEHALGDTIRLSGLSEEGDVVFPTPPKAGPVAHVGVGDLRSRFPSRLATIIVLPAERVLVASYLALFRYLVRPEELRATVSRWAEAPALRPEPAPAAG